MSLDSFFKVPLAIRAFETALALHKDGKFGQARVIYRELLDAYPDSQSVWTMLCQMVHWTVADQEPEEPYVVPPRVGPRRPRFFSLDPALQSMSGHHVNFNLAYIEAAKNLGYDTCLYCHREFEQARSIIEGVTVPMFRDSAYAVKYRSLEVANNEFLCDLSRLDFETIDDDDILFFHTVTPVHVQGLATWLSALYARKRPTVVIMLWTTTATDPEDKNFQTFLWRLRGVAGTRLVFIGTEALPRDQSLLPHLRKIGRFVDFSFAGFPFSMVYQRLERVFTGISDDPEAPLTIGYFGHSNRLQKGVCYLPFIIQKLRARYGERVRFIVQLNFQWRENLLKELPDVARELDRIQSWPYVKVVSGSLDVKEYFDLLAESDIIMMPYGKQYSHFSGVFWEAGVFGKVAVVPGYSLMARGWPASGMEVVAFQDWTISSIVDAVARAVDDFPRLSAVAQDSARHLQRENAPEAIIRRFVDPDA